MPCSAAEMLDIGAEFNRVDQRNVDIDEFFTAFEREITPGSRDIVTAVVRETGESRMNHYVNR